MKVYLYDFLRFYYQEFKNISELKELLDNEGFSLSEIYLILNNLGKKVRINVSEERQYYENDVIINKNQHVYFYSIDIFNKN